MTARLLLPLVMAGIVTAESGEVSADLRVRALSFNVRYGSADDGTNAWPHRKEMVFEVIRDEAPDFCGLQEALRFQLDEIRKAIPQYEEFGAGRTDGKTEGEYSSILYRADRWRLDHGETLWLSDSPREPGSMNWGNTIPRIVTWGRFIEKDTGRKIYVFNTHFDHRSQPSRMKSAEFLVKLISKHHDAPVVVTGDFNAGESNPAIQLLKQQQDSGVLLLDTFRVAHPDAETVGTFNGFEGRSDGEKIDYVFADAAAVVRSAKILRTHQGSRYPSDHYPVNAELVFAAN